MANIIKDNVPYTLKVVLNKQIEKIKFTYNGLEVKVHLKYFEDNIILGIGFFDPNGKYPYENWISKNIIYQNNKHIIINSFIEHPPYKFFSKKLGSLFEFYDKLFDKVNQATANENYVYNFSKKDSEEKIFYLCTAKSPSISKKNQEKIIKTCGIEFYNYLVLMGKTARFTNDISKSKIPKIHK